MLGEVKVCLIFSESCNLLRIQINSAKDSFYTSAIRALYRLMAFSHLRKKEKKDRCPISTLVAQISRVE
ncbi:hypothetical protein CAJAP_06626 [Camponotus japonicus]